MTETTNYGFNIVEGNDLVNPLTQTNPNFENLDEYLKTVSDRTIGKATELKTGTVHALLREDIDIPFIRFTATSNFTAGDTFTVDGVQVSALLTSGEQLGTGAYIIGSEVFCVLKGTLLTFLTSGAVLAKDSEKLGGELPEYYAKKSNLDTVSQTATSAGELAAENATKIENMKMKLLWQNPDPTSEFVSQTIMLNSSDYDYIDVFYKVQPNVNRVISVRVLKGSGTHLSYTQTTNSTYILVYNRIISYVNTVSLSVGDGVLQRTNNTTSQTDNSHIIPIAIYGGKF